MGPWLDAHGQIEAYNQYKSDFDSDNSSWKQYVNLLGYQWFDWGFMPKPVPASGTGIIKLQSDNRLSMLNVYPNPAHEKVMVEINSFTKGDVTLKIADVDGRIVLSENMILNKGINKTTIDLANFNNGIYFLTVQDERNVFSKRIVVAQ